MSASSIQLRGPRFAVEANNALSQVATDKRAEFVWDVARQVLKTVSDDERANVYVVAAYDLCAVAEQTIAASEQLRALCNVVAARILLRGRVSADATQKVGSLSMGAAWTMLGTSPLCPEVRRIVIARDSCVCKLLANFDIALETVDDGVMLHEAAAAVGRIIGSVVEGEPLFHPPPEQAPMK